MDFTALMKQAQAMQEKMQELQGELDEEEVIGSAGAGLVKVTLRGRGEVVAIAIDPELLSQDQGEILQDLLMAAFNDGKTRLDALHQEKTSQAMGGALGGALNGMKLPPGFKF